jgi:hypothetical protein
VYKPCPELLHRQAGRRSSLSLTHTHQLKMQDLFFYGEMQDLLRMRKTKLQVPFLPRSALHRVSRSLPPQKARREPRAGLWTLGPSVSCLDPAALTRRYRYWPSLAGFNDCAKAREALPPCHGERTVFSSEVGSHRVGSGGIL